MAAKQRKKIITCAATGAIHTPTMSGALLLYTYDQITEQAIGAAEACASTLHLPLNGKTCLQPDMSRAAP